MSGSGGRDDGDLLETLKEVAVAASRARARPCTVEKGLTAGGVRVRNVALPVIRRPYAVYCLDALAEAAASAGSSRRTTSTISTAGQRGLR